MTLKTKEEKLALLEETVGFFNSTNRCTNGNSCKYYMEGKAGCAIGRLIEDKELCKRLDNVSDGVCGVGSSSIFAQLPEELKAYGQVFLNHLQNLHDRSSYWLPSGISPKGLDRVDRIKSGIEQGTL